jgi:hypothetical protein
MRLLAVVFITALGVAVAHAEPPAKDAGKRFGISLDMTAYPQATAKEALTSVLKAIDDKRIDYLLAHLADPAFTDRRVRDYGGRFEDVVQEAKAKMLDDPTTAKQLRRFLAEGAWQISGATGRVTLKDLRDRSVYLRKLDSRWFLENRR